MKIFASICGTFVLTFLVHAGAAVLVTGSTIASVTTFSSGDPTDDDPAALTDKKDLANNRGDVGDAISKIDPWTVDIPVPGSFEISSGAISASVIRTTNAGAPVTASAQSVFQFSFELMQGESGELNLDFAYVVQSLGISASTAWALVGPDPNVTNFSGTLVDANLTAVNLSGSISQTATLSTAGTYTFTVSTIVPLQTLQNSNFAAFANLSGFSLAYTRTNVPEPSIGMMVVVPVLAILTRSRSARQSIFN